MHGQMDREGVLKVPACQVFAAPQHSAVVLECVPGFVFIIMDTRVF